MEIRINVYFEGGSFDVTGVDSVQGATSIARALRAAFPVVPVSDPLPEITGVKEEKKAAKEQAVKVMEAEARKEKKEAAKEAPKESTTDSIQKLPPAQSDSSTETATVNYEQVRELIIAISNASKAKAIATLQRFGVANGKQLKEDQYYDFHAYASKVVAGEVDPEKADA